MSYLAHNESSNGSLDFADLAPVEIKVNLFNKKYVLCEASGDAACKYRNAQLKGVKIGTDGRPQSIPENVADSEPLLVSLCLYEADKDGKLRYDKDNLPDPKFRVAIGTVRSWPSRIQKKLFEKVREISQLDEKPTRSVLLRQSELIQQQLAELEDDKAPKSPPQPEDMLVG